MAKHSEIAAKLVVDAAIAAIAGNVAGRLGIAPVVLSERQCAEMGLPTDSNTMMYPVGDSGVFYNLDEARSTIWYTGADSTRALQTVETALKRAYPEAKQAKDEVDPREAGLRVRSFDIKLPQGRLALVNLSYPDAHSRNPRFIAQVVAMTLKN